jgi:hypothetical protein
MANQNTILAREAIGVIRDENEKGKGIPAHVMKAYSSTHS